MTAQLLLLCGVIPDDETPITLRNLRRGGAQVFMGKDKQIIAKLQDELGNHRKLTQRCVSKTKLCRLASVACTYGSQAQLGHAIAYFRDPARLGGNVHSGCIYRDGAQIAKAAHWNKLLTREEVKAVRTRVLWSTADELP